MRFFELYAADISGFDDSDLRELVGRLCEAEVMRQGVQSSSVTWGGAQEAADGGLDVNVKGALLSSPNFIPRADTGFQVKKHKMGKAACKSEMLDHGVPKPILAELAAKNGAYIIVSGQDDCSEKMLSERVAGMKQALTSLDTRNDLFLNFYGRDRLSSWLRQHPGVVLWARLRLGKPLSGWQTSGRWAATPPDKDDNFLLDDHPCVIDKNAPSKAPMTIAEGLRLTRDRLRQPGGTVRITGLSGVGKTRFAQALFETGVGENPLPATEVIYADLGESLTPTATELTAYLIANDLVAYLVLDNCPSDVHRALRKQVSASGKKLHLLTIEYDISDDSPEDTEVVHIEPSSSKTISTLVQKRFPELRQVNANKIAEFASGNARVALALASRVEADETLSNFSDEDLFQRLFSQRKATPDNLIEGAEILSLVYSFNVSQAVFNDELNVLGTMAGIDRRMLHRHHAELLRRQLAQKRGDWRAVLPQALGNRLAKRALQNIPLDDINAELFKPENIRLLKSCAHRLGFLHDADQARQMADSWIAPGGPLHDIAVCGSELLGVLDYIAPVFPDTVLSLIERASSDARFTSRENENYNVFTRLLCHLAYEDESFDRAAAILLKFAEGENHDEKNNSIVNRLQHLFTLYLSGTNASPARRQAFVKNLIESGPRRHRQIAENCLHSAFTTSHWTSFGTFDFGARRRDYGWQPRTNDDVQEWYAGFMRLLDPSLRSADAETQAWAKQVLANHFRSLWSFAGCFDPLEEIVRTHGRGGAWPQIWIAIKQTLSYDGEQCAPEVLGRLEALEKFAAPADIYQEIEAYALCSTWEHIRGRDYHTESEKLRQHISGLGEIAAQDTCHLKRLGAKLWTKHVDALWPFGKGLAKGSRDHSTTFELLVQTLQSVPADSIEPTLLAGYLQGVDETDRRLAKTLYERVLGIPELKPHFVFLLTACPVDHWAVQKVKEMARSGELEPWRFERLKYGRLHEAIADEDLCDILKAVNGLEKGVLSTLEILSMRFYIGADSTYKPSAELCGVGRDALFGLLSMHRDTFNALNLHGLDRVVEECLSPSAPKDDIVKIVSVLCDGIASYRLYSFELKNISRGLITNFPEIVLDAIFTNTDRKDLLAAMMFVDRSGLDEPSLNEAPIGRLVAWCDGDQSRIARLAGAVCAYVGVEAGATPFDNPKRVALTAHIKALLDAATDKLGIVQTIFEATWPRGWSGSLADILDSRAKAFAELLDYPSADVRAMVEVKLQLIEQEVRKNRAREAEENAQREQRFE